MKVLTCHCQPLIIMKPGLHMSTSLVPRAETISAIILLAIFATAHFREGKFITTDEGVLAEFLENIMRLICITIIKTCSARIFTSATIP